MSFCSCSAVNVTGNRPMSAAELAEETHSRTNQVSTGAVLCFSPFQAATRSARNVSLKKCDGRCQDLAIRRHALPLWSGSWPPNPILRSPPAQEGWERMLLPHGGLGTRKQRVLQQLLQPGSSWSPVRPAPCQLSCQAARGKYICCAVPD